MKAFSLLAVAAGIAIHASNVASAPLGVVVVTTEGRRIVVPVADDETDPKNMLDLLRPWRISSEFVRPTQTPDVKLGEGPIAWMTGPGIQMPPHASPDEDNTVDEAERPHPHPHMPGLNIFPEGARIRKGGCTKGGVTTRKGVKGFKLTMAHKMHHIMNRFRAALGLPVVKYHHNHRHHEHHEGARIHHHYPMAGDHAPFMTELKESHDESEPFLTRFSHAMHSLSPWESRAVTFVLGLGLGSLLRMFIVLAIVMIRGRRACRAGGRRFGGCRRRRQAAEAAAAAAQAQALGSPAPPAYTDMVEEKPKAVESTPVFKEVYTVEQNTSGVLEIYWRDADGAEHITPATEFHTKYPQQLIHFYESNLKWKPVEEV